VASFVEILPPCEEILYHAKRVLTANSKWADDGQTEGEMTGKHAAVLFGTKEIKLYRNPTVVLLSKLLYLYL